MIMFFALLFVAAAIAGATAFVIFWPLALVHLRDRHPEVKAQLGEGAFIKPEALWWLFSGRYRQIRDPQFTGLATPARVALIVIASSLVLAGLLWLISKATSP
ncbi:hypothetical protein [Luteimonas mephitis]|uniref:hypothetical protein n=1 Tax=Luteimonas mephitis TaxID=83615 RepID=UPI00047C3EEA|nr:hypothetical protein [Luteimonas mephitis]